jgi:uncharacterized membrane protein
MERKLIWSGGTALIGAGLMALFDPNRGRARRAALRGRASGAAGAIGTAAGKTWRDLRHRTEGAAARGRSLFGSGAGGDDVVTARVRSRLGRVTSHAHAIQVRVADGRVVLSGPVLAREAEAAVDCARAVAGVLSVEDRLERFESGEGIPSLQGPDRPVSRRLFRENWSPAARLLGGAVGAALVAAGARRRDWLGGGMALAGLGLLSRAASNRPMRRLIGLGPSSSRVELRRSIAVEAPIASVYGLWRRWENVPRFFAHVRDVRDEGGGWTRWRVTAADGRELAFNVVMTATIPDHLIAWRTAPRQPVRHSGVVRFDEISPELTRVEVQLSYAQAREGRGPSPLGRNPEAALEDDLQRMKSIVERGTASGSSDAAATLQGEGAGSAGDALRAPAPEAPVQRTEPLAATPEEAIVAAQDAGAAPLIQEEPGQTEPYAEDAAASPKPARRRARRKRGEGTDQVDL